MCPCKTRRFSPLKAPLQDVKNSWGAFQPPYPPSSSKIVRLQESVFRMASFKRQTRNTSEFGQKKKSLTTILVKSVLQSPKQPLIISSIAALPTLSGLLLASSFHRRCTALTSMSLPAHLPFTIRASTTSSLVLLAPLEMSKCQGFQRRSHPCVK